MSVRITSADPLITLDTVEFERQFAAACKALGITTQAQLVTAVGNMLAGGAAELAIVKAVALSIMILP